MVDVICEHCGKHFSVRNYRKETARFCSRKCKDNSLKGKAPWNKQEQIMIKCEYCEKQFSVVRSRVATARFCSRACQNKWLAKNLKKYGPDNPMYKTGSAPNHYRREAFRIHGEKCNRCGTTENLVVHHIDENRNNNPLDGSNWEILCKRCHQLHHGCIDKLPKRI